MGGVPDEEQAGPVPPPQAVEQDHQHAHVLEAPELLGAAREEGQQRADGRAHRLDALGLEQLVAPLGDEVGELPVRLPVDRDHHVAGGDAEEELLRIALLAGQPEPGDVHGGAALHRHQARRPPHVGVPPVGPHGQGGAKLVLALGVPVADAAYRAALADDPDDLGLHDQPEGRVAPGRRDDQVEEIPLRHECDVGELGPEPSQGGQLDDAVIGPDRQVVRLAVRQGVEFLGQAQLVEHLESRGMDRVSPEVAQEVGVLLQERHVHARAGEEQSQHGPGGAPSGDHTCGRHIHHPLKSLHTSPSRQTLPRGRPGGSSRARRAAEE